MTFPDDGREYLDVEACARRMGLTVAEVMELVSGGALRHVDYGFGLFYVEPAILSGARSTRED